MRHRIPRRRCARKGCTATAEGDLACPPCQSELDLHGRAIQEAWARTARGGVSLESSARSDVQWDLHLKARAAYQDELRKLPPKEA